MYTQFIWDFLTMRTQYVQVDKNRSKSVEINTGSSDGRVSLPVLTIYMYKQLQINTGMLPCHQICK